MSDASWTERVILLLLIAASLGMFWMRFRHVVDVLKRARPTSDFDLNPIRPRVRQFVWEVVAQGKVIVQRPLPGLAHAFVFWGFCAFALITLNHIGSAFGAQFLSPNTSFGRFYFAFVAVWAIAVAISIAGLFVRRFIVRRTKHLYSFPAYSLVLRSLCSSSRSRNMIWSPLPSGRSCTPSALVAS